MRLFIILAFLCTSTLSYAQSFEGTLTYVADFRVSGDFIKAGVTKEALLARMNQDGSWADTIWVSYKQGNYHTSKNTTPRSSAIYKPEANKIYSLQEGEHAGICTVTDASQDLAYATTGKTRTILKLDTAVTVNGVACTLIRVKLEDQIIDYYYNPGHLQVNPALFSQHKYEGLADFLKMSKALPLKMEKTINGMFTVTMTLVSTQAVAIDEGIFTIPALAPDPSLNLIKVANQEVMRIKR